jgi:hypothetical protein
MLMMLLLLRGWGMSGSDMWKRDECMNLGEIY